jgi:hypothetical protein
MQGYTYAASSYAQPSASSYAQPSPYAAPQGGSYTGISSQHATPSAYVAASAAPQALYPASYQQPAGPPPLPLGGAPPQPEDLDFDAMKAQLKSEYDARVADLGVWFHHENDKIMEREREHKLQVQEYQEHISKQNKHRELYEQIKRAEIDRYERDREAAEASAAQAAKDNRARYDAWADQQRKDEEARRRNPQLPTAKLGAPYGMNAGQPGLPNTYAQPAATTQILSYGR